MLLCMYYYYYYYYYYYHLCAQQANFIYNDESIVYIQDFVRI
jgi:hypothetical protein